MQKNENRDTFNFEKLVVYQKSLDFIDFVYQLTEKFPKSEMFGLTSQYKRAACSIALNIGEGSGGTVAEFRNFIRISFRSLNECVVCSTVATRRKFITEVEDQKSRQQLLEITRMLSGLRNSLHQK
ncbi:MAG: four helix bundle protein [Bacteroidota bacterium]